MAKIKYRKNQNGLSLIEVMAAMVVLAIGIFGLAPMMIITQGANSFSRDLSQADNLAQDRMESLRLVGNFAPIPYTTTESNLLGRFTRTTRVDSYESDPTVPSKVYRTDVTITWSDQNGLPRTSSYSTYMAKN